VRVGTHQVDVQLVGVHFGQEIAAAGEVFQVEKLVLFEPVHGFHIALVGVRRRDAHMLAVREGFGEVALELAAVGGLPDQIPQGNTIAIQMLLDARGKHGAGGGTSLLGKSPEEQVAADVTSGVLNGRQVQVLHLQPVARDIVKILGIGADLLEQSPGSFDVCEILLALILPAALFQQAVSPPDAFQRTVTDGQVELTDQPARTERRQRFA